MKLCTMRTATSKRRRRPPVGAWIETLPKRRAHLPARVAPPWGRGLKPQSNLDSLARYPVAPPVGAWIETVLGRLSGWRHWCRPPRGGVD